MAKRTQFPRGNYIDRREDTRREEESVEGLPPGGILSIMMWNLYFDCLRDLILDNFKARDSIWGESGGRCMPVDSDEHGFGGIKVVAADRTTSGRQRTW